jgi:hypothetical protein
MLLAGAKGHGETGHKMGSSYWLHAGRETDRSGECFSLAQRGMAGRVGRQSVMWSKFKKEGQISYIGCLKSNDTLTIYLAKALSGFQFVLSTFLFFHHEPGSIVY